MSAAPNPPIDRPIIVHSAAATTSPITMAKSDTASLPHITTTSPAPRPGSSSSSHHLHSGTSPAPSSLDPPQPKLPLSWRSPSHWPKLILLALIRSWFTIGVILAIVFAYLFPYFGENGGPIRAEYTIKYGAVMVVFFLSGLSMKTAVLKQAVSQWRGHILIQLISLGLVPALGFGVSKVLAFTGLNDSLIAGLVVCVCMPTTISSNVIMTAAAKGNEALSLINATLGNILGIVLSPLLLLLYLGARTTINFIKILTDIPITVIGPLLVGQIIRKLFPRKVEYVMKRVNFSTISSCMLLLLIYASFADNFAKGTMRVTVVDVFGIIAVVWVFLPIVMTICLVIGLMFRFPRPDVVSIIFCGSTKTLSLGIPLLGIIYRDDPNNGIYSLPLLVYHASQLFIGGWAVGPLSKWVKSISSSPAHSESSLLPILNDGVPSTPHPPIPSALLQANRTSSVNDAEPPASRNEA